MNTSNIQSDQPQTNQQFYDKMRDLYDKLIILNYETTFVNKYKTSLIHRYYFLNSTNLSEQFYVFICLCEWLIKDKCKLTLENEIKFDSFEDPNLIISNIMDALKQIGKPFDFEPNKLKQGHGTEVIYVLNYLADEALKNFTFVKKVDVEIKNLTKSIDKYSSLDEITKKNLENNLNEEHLELNEDDEKYLFAEQEFTIVEDNDEDDYEDSPQINNENKDKLKNELNNKELEIKLFQSLLNENLIKNEFQKENWLEEVQQMLPQLKLISKTVKNLRLDWRSRFAELKKRNLHINDKLISCNEGLSKLELDTKKRLEHLNSREHYLQQQMDALCNELLAYRSELNRSNQNYQQINGGIIEKSKNLTQLTEQIRKIKNEIEKRNNQVSDSSHLVLLHQTLTRLRVEINGFNVRLGVALRNILQFKLQHTLNKIQFNTITNNAFENQIYTDPDVTKHSNNNMNTLKLIF